MLNEGIKLDERIRIEERKDAFSSSVLASFGLLPSGLVMLIGYRLFDSRKSLGWFEVVVGCHEIEVQSDRTMLTKLSSQH